jgi:hypothetical protein
MNTPSQELAKNILERLIAEKLFTAEDSERLAEKMVHGKMRLEDWRLAVEKAIEIEAKA